MPEYGDEYVYRHPRGYGLGKAAKGEPLTTDMHELDLVDGTTVKFLVYDVDSGWPIVEWTDQAGNSRITTIDPVEFGSHFA